MLLAATQVLAHRRRNRGCCRRTVEVAASAIGEFGERALGFFGLGTRLWLTTFAVTLNTTVGMHLLL